MSQDERRETNEPVEWDDHLDPEDSEQEDAEETDEFEETDESDEPEESDELEEDEEFEEETEDEYAPDVKRPKPGATKRQTRSYLMKRFETLGIRPRQKLGQNFLIDLNLLQLLFESAKIDERDVVLEVGTGTGSLTQAMSEVAAAVVTVEIDSIVQEMAKQELAGKSNVRFILTDILKGKNALKEEVLEAIRSELAVSPDRRFKLCANLPYSIATPLLSNLLLSDIPPFSMTVTIQKELADRIAARPGTKDYGSLAVWMQAMCDTYLIRVMPPSVFWPRPKVSSAIIQVVYNEKKRRKIKDLKFFHRFTRDLFLHRRKFIRSVLCSAFKRELTKEDVDRILAERQIGPTIRAEMLTVREILALSDAFQAELTHRDE